MRKRIVTGLLATVMVAVGVYFALQPKKGSLEYHKKEYRNTRLYLGGYNRSLSDRLRYIYMRVTGKRVSLFKKGEVWPLLEKWRAHEEALLQMGFLVKREIAVRNADGHPVFKEAKSKTAIEHYAYARLGMDTSGTGIVDVIVLTAPRSEVGRWEDLIRRADAPKNSE